MGMTHCDMNSVVFLTNPEDRITIGGKVDDPGVKP